MQWAALKPEIKRGFQEAAVALFRVVRPNEIIPRKLASSVLIWKPHSFSGKALAQAGMRKLKS